MAKIATRIHVDNRDKTISWSDKHTGKRQETEIIVGPNYVLPNLYRMPFSAYCWDTNLNEELEDYLAKPRKSLGGQSFDDLLMESYEGDHLEEAADQYFADLCDDDDTEVLSINPEKAN